MARCPNVACYLKNRVIALAIGFIIGTSLCPDSSPTPYTLDKVAPGMCAADVDLLFVCSVLQPLNLSRLLNDGAQGGQDHQVSPSAPETTTPTMTPIIAISYRYFSATDMKHYRVVPTFSGAMNPANWDNSENGALAPMGKVIACVA
jgi:hypothetical protein